MRHSSPEGPPASGPGAPAGGPRLVEIPELRDRRGVFRDRADAGARLAAMLEHYRGRDAIVVAIPSGGVPVAKAIASALGLSLEVAPVSKMLLPWTTEAGFGAVAFDGSEWVDDEAVAAFGLSERDVAASRAVALAKVHRRMQRLRGDRPFPALAGRAALLVDDGIAAGSTLRAALAALRRLGAGEIVVAVPTAHDRSAALVAALADRLYCANVRGGGRYAVAEAYQSWADVTEDEVEAMLAAGPRAGTSGTQT